MGEHEGGAGVPQVVHAQGVGYQALGVDPPLHLLRGANESRGDLLDGSPASANVRALVCSLMSRASAALKAR